MERNRPGFDQFVAERLFEPCVPAYGRKRKRRKSRKRNELTSGMKMIRQRRPPRRFNKVIEVVLLLSKLGRLRFQTCEFAINAIKNSNNEGEQHSSPKIPAGIKQRHA